MSKTIPKFCEVICWLRCSECGQHNEAETKLPPFSDIFKCFSRMNFFFLNLIHILRVFVPMCLINYWSVLVGVMPWHRGQKKLNDLILNRFTPTSFRQQNLMLLYPTIYPRYIFRSSLAMCNDLTFNYTINIFQLQCTLNCHDYSQWCPFHDKKYFAWCQTVLSET